MRTWRPLVVGWVVAALLPVAGTTAAAAPEDDAPARDPRDRSAVVDALAGLLGRAPGAPPADDRVDDAARYEYGEGTAPREYFVRLAGLPAAINPGAEVGNRIASARRDPGTGTYELRSEQQGLTAYREQLADAQRQVATEDAVAAIGRELEVLGGVTVANHGFVAVMTPAEARRLAQLDEVVALAPMPTYAPTSDRGPAWVNAAGAAWERSGTTVTGVLGEGVVVGVIDTGINPANPAFAATSADGYTHVNPRPKLYGSCDPTNNGTQPPDRWFWWTEPVTSPFDPAIAAQCNGKLIGMYGYTSVTSRGASTLPAGSPIDYDGHGSHTAGTAAGGFVDGVSMSLPVGLSLPGNDFDLSGVAPRASLISYAACCDGTALLTALDQMLLDGVDVLNFSLGADEPTGNVLNDPVVFAFLIADLSGIHVATSAGNDGPGAATAGTPGDVPWILTVAASTHDRLHRNALVDLWAPGGPFLPDLVGKSVTGSLGPRPIVYAGDHGNPLCRWNDDDAPFPVEERIWAPGTFSGEIVVCDRGGNGRVEKSAVAAAAGAGGFVLVNDATTAGSPEASLSGDAYVLPGVHLTHVDGETLKAWLAEVDDPSASIAGTSYEYDDAYGDQLAVFSSRGPNRTDVDVLLPHLTAPGMDVIAPHGRDNTISFQALSGTSMSSPHAAGALALLVEHSDGWLTAAEARSALQLTARRTVLATDGTTPANPYEVGSGHLDVAAALATGIVMDETFFDYFDAYFDGMPLPDARDLNLPSLVDTSCLVQCTFTRRVTAPPWVTSTLWSASGTVEGGTVSVSPSTFTLPQGQTRTITVTVTPDGTRPGVPSFGAVELTTTASVTDVHMPIAVVASSFGPSDPAVLASDGYTDDGVASFVAGVGGDLDLDVGPLTPGDLTVLDVGQGPVSAYADLGAVEVVDVVVPPGGAPRLLAELHDSLAPDLDLFVGRYEGPGDVPRVATEQCASTSPGPLERCVIPDPEPGTWWVLVHGFDVGPDDVARTRLTTLPGAGTSVMPTVVSAPETVVVGEWFDVALAWDLPAPALRWFGEVTFAADDPATPTTLPVEVHVTTAPPVAEAGGPYTVGIGQALVLDGSGSTHPTAKLDVTSYAWDLSDLGLPPASGVAPAVTASTSAGTYEIGLTVEDAVGARGHATTTVTVVDLCDPDLPGGPDPSCAPACPPGVGPIFPDALSGPHAANIRCVAHYGIAQGTSGGLYDPSATVSRAQMATFLARTLEVAGVELPAVPTSSWPDVTSGTHKLAIERLTDIGVIQGTNAGTYNPSGTVTRAQMATFLRRTLEQVLGPLPAAPASPFVDVVGNAHRPAIDVVHHLGIAQGVTATTFVPQQPVRRDQMASFLARTLQVLVDAHVPLTPLTPPG